MLPSQLIVARYQENIDWISAVPQEIQIVVYNKFYPDSNPETFLPNIGRETHTYLYHILTHWEKLPDTMAFVQGNPFDHTVNLMGKLENIPHDLHFGILSDSIYADIGTGGPWAWGLPFDKWYKLAFSREEGLNYYAFGAGAQFAITRQAIQQRSRSFYEHVFAIISDPHQTYEFGHAMERFWYYVFNMDHTKHPRRTDLFNLDDVNVTILDK